MPVVDLDRITVETLPTVSDLGERRQVLYWDDTLAGLGLLCSRNAKGITRSFVVQRNGVRCTLGRYPATSIKKARQRARDVIGELRRPRVAGRSTTLRQAAQAYPDGMAQRGCSPRSIADLRFNIDHYLTGWLDRPLRSIDGGMVQGRHRAIGKANGKSQANRTMRNLRAIYNDAMTLDHELRNPCVALRKRWFKERQRRETVTNLAEWYARVRALPNPLRRAFQEFVLLTGLRSEDARTIKWQHMDFEAATLHRPNPKGGEDRAFRIPLSRRALAVLRYARMVNRKLYSGSPWVFSTRDRRGQVTYMREAKEQRQIDGKKLNRLPGPHVLRHTYITIAFSAGVPDYEIGMLANHRLPKGTITQKYAGEHAALTERLRKSQELISTALLAKLRGDY